MLPWIICVVFFVMLIIGGLACSSMWMRIQRMERDLIGQGRGISDELDQLRAKHHAFRGLIFRLNQQTVEILVRLSDEAERAVGHTRETQWLENLPLDVKRAAGGWIDLRDADEIRNAGYIVPDARSCDLADVLRLAVDIDRAVRNVELPLWNVFRRCQLDRSKACGIGDVLAMVQRLQHGDARQARKVLTAAIDIWEASDLPTAVAILEHDPELTMARG
jgi:hypothetical protein